MLWGLAEDRPLYRLDQSADHLAFSPDGRTLLGVGRDGIAQVWDPRNGTLRETIRVCEAGHFAIRDIAVAPDSRHFAAALGNGTRGSSGSSPRQSGRAARAAAGRRGPARAADRPLEATDRQAGARVPRDQGLGRRTSGQARRPPREIRPAPLLELVRANFRWPG